MIEIDELTVSEIVDGYIYDGENQCFICLLCGKQFEKGEIFQLNERFYDAEKAIEVHLNEEHPERFNELINSDSKYLSITPTQKELIRLFHLGLSDSDVAKTLNISPSTVRHQKFMFREKAKQAKMYLAMWEMVLTSTNAQKAESGKLVKEDLLPIHEGAKMVDERYVLTEEENKKILESVCLSLNPLKLKVFPAKEKKKIAVLNLIATQFEKNKHYQEAEINEVLKAIYDDFVTIRRYMIEYGYMKRTDDGSEYWLK